MKPTEEQLREIAAAIERAGDDPWGKGIADDMWPDMAEAAWNLIAPMALEAAAQMLTAPAVTPDPGAFFTRRPDHEQAMEWAAARIRSMAKETV